MRADRVKLAGLIALAAVLAAAGVRAGTSQPAQGDALIRIFAVPKAHLDEGRSPGSRSIELATLRDRRDRTIGHSFLLCVALLEGASACQATYVLPLGKITAQGSRHRASYFVLAVTGGTGVYARARGTLVSSEQPGGRARLLFSLEP